MPTILITTSRRHLLAPLMGVAATLIALVLLLACSSTARFGDPDGVPVAVTVQLDPAYLASADHDPVHPSSAGGGNMPPSGIDRIELLGCESVGEGEVFHKEVGLGESTFAIPLDPGHRLELALVVIGGHETRAGLGDIAIPLQPPIRISIRLDRSGSRLAVSDGLGHVEERNAPVPEFSAPGKSPLSSPPLDEPTVLPPPRRPLN
jgi:hypothetical protein